MAAVGSPDPYRSYSSYLRQRYGGPVHRVAVDAGFSCPNRGGSAREAAGCLYCDGAGARAPYLGQIPIPSSPQPADPLWQGSVRRQVQAGMAFLRSRYGAERFLLYFQAFSNTFAPVPLLKAVYDFALGCGPFLELVVSTRPDCIDEEVARLLAGYRDRVREVWVELGLQSAHEATLRRINRGHTVAQFDRAFRVLRGQNLRLAVHLIFGLPGEDLGDILATVRHVAALRPDAVKIHNLHVCRGSPLAAAYLAGELTVPSGPRHLEYVLRALELLPPRTIVMRLTCDTPPDRLIAPRGFPDKPAFLRDLRQRLRGRPGEPDPPAAPGETPGSLAR